jgi:hypothetical protein
MSLRLAAARWRERCRLITSRRRSPWVLVIPWTSGSTISSGPTRTEGVSSAPRPDPRLENLQQRGAGERIWSRSGVGRRDGRINR